MGITRRVVAVLLAILVVLPLATATLTLIPISTWVLDRYFYRTLAHDTRVYELWQVETLPDYLIIEGKTGVESLPADALGSALRTVTTPSYLRDQAVGVIDQSFDILEGKAASTDVFIDIAPIKATLRGPAAATFAETLAAGLPVCAGDQEPVASGASIPRCRVPGDSTGQTAALVAAGLPAYLNRLPDQVNITSADTGAAYPFLRFNWLGAGRVGLGLAILVLSLITMAFWLLTAAIGANGAGERLQWLGWMLRVPAGLVFLMGPAMYVEPWRNWLRYSWFSVAEGPNAEFYRLALQTSAGTALRTIAAGFIITGAVASIAAVIAIRMGGTASRQRRVVHAIGAEPTAATPQ